MAHLLSLIALLGLLLADGAAAAIQPQSAWWLGAGANSVYFSCGSDGCLASSPQGVCDRVTAGLYSPQAERVSLDNGGRDCTVRSKGNGVSLSTWSIKAASPICPANSTLSGGACGCNSGFLESAGACISQEDQLAEECAALAGKSAGNAKWNGNSSEFYFCDSLRSEGGGRCLAKAGLDLSHPDRLTGKISSVGRSVYTGDLAGSCDGSGGSGETPGPRLAGNGEDSGPLPDNASEPAPCPIGQGPVALNGTTICAPLGEDVETTAPSPDSGSLSTTSADGSTITTETEGTTTCAGGECTTTNEVTTTTTDEDGNVIESETQTETEVASQTSFCAENLNSPQCAGQGGSDTSFGGNCASGFQAYSDDAVLNAMAEEQHKRNCQLLDTAGSEAQELAAEMAKTGDQTGDNPNNSTVSIGPGDFDMSDALGGGSCNLSKDITVLGHTARLPFNELCQPLAVLGQLLVAVSLLLAARIVTRG